MRLSVLRRDLGVSRNAGWLGILFIAVLITIFAVVAGIHISSRNSADFGGVSRGRFPMAVPARVGDAYDDQVLALHPVLYLTLGDASTGEARDLSGNGLDGLYLPRRSLLASSRLPNGDFAASFDGRDQYVEVRSSRQLSVTLTGCLTVEAWFRPAALQFPVQQGSGYVYVLGKGIQGKQEYALRMYSFSNSESP